MWSAESCADEDYLSLLRCVNWQIIQTFRRSILYQTKFLNLILVILSITYLLTYLLTPWCRVLLEKLTGLQLVKKLHAFHGNRRFITALTSVHHLSLSWASPIQSIYPHPTSWRSILILFAHLRLGLPSGLLPSGFPTKTLYTPLSSPIRSTCPAHRFLSIYRLRGKITFLVPLQSSHDLLTIASKIIKKENMSLSIATGLWFV